VRGDGFREPSELLLVVALVAIVVLVLVAFGQALIAAVLGGTALALLAARYVVNRMRR
jgi:Flp pilus assembly protein TadB